MTLILLCGMVLGAVLYGPCRKAIRKLRKDDAKALDASEKAAMAKGYEKGKADALSVLAETDENAAIIEALGNGTLTQNLVKPITVADVKRWAEITGVDPAIPQQAWGYTSSYILGLYTQPHEDRRWTWADESLTRAGLSAVAESPRAAYRLYMSFKERAAAICEQLDEVDRIRKEES